MVIMTIYILSIYKYIYLHYQKKIVFRVNEKRYAKSVSYYNNFYNSEMAYFESTNKNKKQMYAIYTN